MRCWNPYYCGSARLRGRTERYLVISWGLKAAEAGWISYSKRGDGVFEGRQKGYGWPAIIEGLWRALSKHVAIAVFYVAAHTAVH